MLLIILKYTALVNDNKGPKEICRLLNLKQHIQRGNKLSKPVRWIE